MNEHMPMIQTDKPPTEEQLKTLSEAFALQRRMGLIGKWVNEGHIEIEALHTVEQYQIMCGGVYFRELKGDFPSEATIARIGLAIHSGATGTDEERAHRVARRNAGRRPGSDAYRYDMQSRIQKPGDTDYVRSYLRDDELSEIKGDVYAKVAEMTRSAGIDATKRLDKWKRGF